jgi:hypothetical protein
VLYLNPKLKDSDIPHKTSVAEEIKIKGDYLDTVDFEFVQVSANRVSHHQLCTKYSQMTLEYPLMHYTGLRRLEHEKPTKFHRNWHPIHQCKGRQREQLENSPMSALF